MTTLHPRGVNHLALSTTDMKRQLTFWCDVLGVPLKALYWMHGVEGAYHGFVELAPDLPAKFGLGSRLSKCRSGGARGRRPPLRQSSM